MELLLRLLVNIGHLNFAMAQMRNENDQEATQGPPLGFFTDAVFERLGDWFGRTSGGESQIERALSRVQLDDSMLDPINAVLDRDIGSVTWRRLNKDYRNEAISHQTFKADVWNIVLTPRGIDQSTFFESQQLFIDDLAPRLRSLQSEVQQIFKSRYPDIYPMMIERFRIRLVR